MRDPLARPVSILFLLFGTSVFAADPKKSLEQGDLKALQGTWRIVVVEFEGKDRSGYIGRDDAFIFKDDVFVLRQPKKAPAFKFKLDPAAKPKSLDFVHEESKEAAEGIYEIGGDDLKISYGPKRPKEFSTAPGQKALSFRLKRVKNADADTLKRFQEECAAGKVAMAQVRIEEALKRLDKALTLAREYYGDEHSETAEVMLKLAFIYREIGQPAKAEPLYSRSLPIVVRVSGPDAKLAEEISSSLAKVCVLIGLFDKAERHYRSNLDKAEKLHGRRAEETIPALVEYAEFHRRCGRFAEAGRMLERAQRIAIAKRGPDDARIVPVFHGLGLLHKDLGNIAEAEQFLRASLKLREAPLAGWHSAAVVGWAPFWALMVKEARKTRADLRLDTWRIRYDLAKLLGSVGQADKQVELLTRALKDLAEQLVASPIDQAVVRSDLALLFIQAGLDDEGALLLDKSVRELEELVGASSPILAELLYTQGYANLWRGRYKAAAEFFSRGRKVAENAFGEMPHRSQADFFWGTGSILALAGNYAEADSAFSFGLILLGSSPDGKGQPQYGSRLREHALMKALGGRKEAADYLEKALEAEQEYLRRVFSFSSETAMHDYLSLLNRDLPFVAALALRGGEGGLSSERALTWVIRRKTVVLDALMRNRAAQRLVASDPDVENLVARRDGLDLRLQNTVLRHGVDPKQIPAQLAALAREKEEVEADLHRRLSKIAPAATMEADAGRVQAAMPAGSALVEFLAVAPLDLKAKLYGQLFEPKPRYLAFVLLPGKEPPKLFDLGESAAIDALVRQLRGDLEKTQTRYKNRFLKEAEQEKEFKAIARELHDAVFAILKPALGNAKRLYLAADGLLNTVPFEALVDADGKYLLESHRFVYLASGQDLLRPKPPAARGTTVFAGPNYKLSGEKRLTKFKEMTRLKETNPPPLDRPPAVVASRVFAVRGTRGDLWSDLAGAAAEAKLVREALASDDFAPLAVFTGDQALEEVFKAQSAPRVLHLATHGFYYPPLDADDKKRFVPIGGVAGLQGRLRRLDNPLWRSGIVLAGADVVDKNPLAVEDGWLTAAEIALLDFQGTELVVLSACQTGLGDVRAGEGVSGLRRAFQHAGARTVMMTLFEIPDHETTSLMRAFYCRFAAGKGKLAALHEAKLKIVNARRKDGAAHPFFWAGFVLAGDPD